MREHVKLPSLLSAFKQTWAVSKYYISCYIKFRGNPFSGSRTQINSSATEIIKGAFLQFFPANSQTIFRYHFGSVKIKDSKLDGGYTPMYCSLQWHVGLCCSHVGSLTFGISIYVTNLKLSGLTYRQNGKSSIYSISLTYHKMCRRSIHYCHYAKFRVTIATSVTTMHGRQLRIMSPASRIFFRCIVSILWPFIIFDKDMWSVDAT
jgi:hypothetical protein